MDDVTYPDMRLNVVHAVAALADAERQRRVWADGVLPEDEHFGDLTFQINMLDDVWIRDAPADCLGDLLRDLDEVAAMQALADALDDVFDRYGYHLSDEHYLNLPEWPHVVASAGAALAVLTRPWTTGPRAAPVQARSTECGKSNTPFGS
ncbi:hypothetical protein JOF53_000839 [Crossiella equi]|uniref:CdiI immunity protein domain-containing protein n=1 Tax=Crossiella equi TaxID=130796 RepID=A0ABS5A5U3_9PSEU|nr:hypothetical protein [Crossiella equi]MBP2471967.1 hypothetical protein [Crossiella equi]